jgi:hypothetical protein
MERGLQIVLKSGFLLLLCLLSQPALAGQASDPVTDKPVIIRQQGEIPGYMSLPLEQGSIDATFTASELGVTHGKVLLLPDSDSGIDGAGLIHILRTALPASGWSTMTMMLDFTALAEPADETTQTNDASEAVATLPEPAEQTDNTSTAESEAKDTNKARLQAAIAYLDQSAEGPLIILAQGRAAALALTAETTDQQGWIWLDPKLKLAEPQPQVPILDIASDSPASVNPHAQERMILARQNQLAAYSQRQIAGAAYGFVGFEANVLSYTRGWLNKNFVEKADN